MKTQKKKLVFGKHSITELNEIQALGINGGCQWSDSSGPSIIKISINPPKDPMSIKDFQETVLGQ